MLHLAALGFQQYATLSPQRAQNTDGIGGTEGPAEQAVSHELLQPLAVRYIGLAARGVLHAARIDQQHR